MGLYAIGVVEQPYVKIGITNGGPTSRLSELQVGCPFELAVLAFDPAMDRAEELRLHHRFMAHSVRGEWFKVEGPVIDWLIDFRISHGEPSGGWKTLAKPIKPKKRPAKIEVDMAEIRALQAKLRK